VLDSEIHHLRVQRPTARQLAEIVRTFRERLLAGFSWNVLSAISLQGSVLLSTIIVARLLGLQSFGAYSVLVSTVMTIAAVAQGGSGLVATKYVAEFLASDPARVGRVLGLCRVFTMAMGACTAALVFSAAGLLSADVLGKPELESLVRLVAVATFFQVGVSYQFGALQGFGAFKELSRASMLAGVGQIALTALGAWLGQITGALLGFVLASALRTIFCRYMLRKVCLAHGVVEEFVLDMDEVRRLWRFALPVGLAGLVTMPCLWLVTVWVARMPDGLELVAMLSIANQIRLAALQLPVLLNTVSFSQLSRLKGLNETIGFRRVFWTSLAISLSFSVVVVTLLMLLAEPILRLYGSNFEDARWLLMTLLLSVLPEIMAVSSYQLIQSAGRMWYSLLAISIPRDLLYLLLASQLLPTFGLIGAGYAYLAAWICALLAILVTIRRSRLL
jgi:O-antigen/teichoic acid export membrane protein